VIITINSHAGKYYQPGQSRAVWTGGRKHTDVPPYFSISTPFYFPSIFQLRAPSNLLSAAVPAR
jgi:hypothetical protein